MIIIADFTDCMSFLPPDSTMSACVGCDGEREAGAKYCKRCQEEIEWIEADGFTLSQLDRAIIAVRTAIFRLGLSLTRSARYSGSVARTILRPRPKRWPIKVRG